MMILNRQAIRPMLRLKRPITFYLIPTYLHQKLDVLKVSLGYRSFKDWGELEGVLRRRRVRTHKYADVIKGEYKYNSRSNHLHLDFDCNNCRHEFNTGIIVADTGFGLRIIDVLPMNSNELTEFDGVVFDYFI